MRLLPLLLALVLAVPAVAGADATTARRAAPVVKVADSQYGRTIVDRRGFALYLFTRDRGGRSSCYGACAKAWPPYVLRRGQRLAVGGGLRRSLLRTTRRRDGSRQVVYNGHPLYYYVADREPGQILCQNVREFGGDWLVVKPNGTPNRAPR